MSSVAALTSAEKRLEAISANLANLHVNGFKRSTSASVMFDTMLNGRMETHVSSRKVTDFSQGPLRQTGEPLDLALYGKGFFTIDDQNGEVYTRDGRFFVDDKGVLQTLEGLPVAWEGARGTIDPTGKPVTIDGEGNVAQGEQKVGKLRIVDFERTDRLRMLKGGFYSAPSALQPQPSTAQVRQGFLEQSNAEAIDELVSMIAVQRQFEAGTRLMTAIDQSYKRLTNPR